MLVCVCGDAKLVSGDGWLSAARCSPPKAKAIGHWSLGIGRRAQRHSGTAAATVALRFTQMSEGKPDAVERERRKRKRERKRDRQRLEAKKSLNIDVDVRAQNLLCALLTSKCVRLCICPLWGRAPPPPWLVRDVLYV
eukprot:scaffold8109_cov110-Isochrysis_galbana.AAC.4